MNPSVLRLAMFSGTLVVFALPTARVVTKALTAIEDDALRVTPMRPLRLFAELLWRNIMGWVPFFALMLGGAACLVWRVKLPQGSVNLHGTGRILLSETYLPLTIVAWIEILIFILFFSRWIRSAAVLGLASWAIAVGMLAGSNFVFWHAVLDSRYSWELAAIEVYPMTVPPPVFILLAYAVFVRFTIWREGVLR